MIDHELIAAYHELYNLMWNKIATYDIDVSGMNGITYDDENLIASACEKIERLLFRDSADDGRPHGGHAEVEVLSGDAASN